MYFFGLHIIYIWMIILIATIAVEALTLDLVSIWFGLGALVALLLASFGVPIGVQLICFVIVAAICLTCIRPFARKFLRIKQEPTNFDRIIGQTAIVTEEINNALAQGRIKIMGQSWSARNATENENLTVGQEVQVLSITGVKAIVKKIEREQV